MSRKGVERLQQLITQGYDALRRQVAYRLGGSSDMASDALHEAYVRLASQDNLDEVRHPHAYLVNTAVNVAIDRIRSDARLLGDDEIEAVFEQARGAQPGLDSDLAARQRLDTAMRALQDMPPRQSALLIAHRVHGEDTESLARRWGISARMVRREIQTAAQTCMAAMEARDVPKKTR